MVGTQGVKPCPLEPNSSVLIDILCPNQNKFGTTGGIRTHTTYTLNVLPAANWTTVAYINCIIWTRTRIPVQRVQATFMTNTFLVFPSETVFQVFPL